MKNKSTSRSVLICLFTVLAFAIYSSPAWANSTTWTYVGTSDWFTDANWSTHVPTFSTDASIDNGGTAQINHQANNTNAAAKSLILGTNQGNSGSVTIDGTNFGALVVQSECNGQNPGDVYVGKQGSGKVSVTNGGFIVSSYGYIAAETSPTGGASNGSVTISGQNSYWAVTGATCTGDAELFVGCTATTDAGGTALLNVQDPADVEVENSNADHEDVKVGLSGTLTGNGFLVMGGPTSLSVTASVLGTLAPAGTLTIVGNLALDRRATTQCNVTPQASDNVQVSEQCAGQPDGQCGHTALDGRLSVIMTGDFSSAPTRFLLLHADAGLNQTVFFSQSIKYPTGQGWTPQITYDYTGGNVYLDRVYDLNP